MKLSRSQKIILYYIVPPVLLVTAIVLVIFIYLQVHKPVEMDVTSTGFTLSTIEINEGETVHFVNHSDVVQVLYAQLHPEFGYDTINLHVVEREGWAHAFPIEGGVLQDVRRFRLADSHFADYYRRPRTVVTYADRSTIYTSVRGPGLKKRVQTLIWVPVLHRKQIVASVSYQLYVRREVPPEEAGRGGS